METNPLKVMAVDLSFEDRRRFLFEEEEEEKENKIIPCVLASLSSLERRMCASPKRKPVIRKSSSNQRTPCFNQFKKFF
jgi:hypothetical protein